MRLKAVQNLLLDVLLLWTWMFNNHGIPEEAERSYCALATLGIQVFGTGHCSGW